MRISQYLHLDKRLKSLRIGADISQKKMAQMLNLSVPTYSNYENGYSEPPVEILEKVCEIIGVPFEDFLGFQSPYDNEYTLETYSDIVTILIALERAGIDISYSTSVNSETRSLETSIKIDNAQVTSLISRWTELNDKLANGSIDSDEYNVWIDNLMKSFNIPITDK